MDKWRSILLPAAAVAATAMLTLSGCYVGPPPGHVRAFHDDDWGYGYHYRPYYRHHDYRGDYDYD